MAIAEVLRQLQIGMGQPAAGKRARGGASGTVRSGDERVRRLSSSEASSTRTMKMSDLG